jgi:hypothetical protein
MPETPRFLIAKKEYDKARLVFMQMARWNGKSEVEALNFIFDQEAEDKN